MADIICTGLTLLWSLRVKEASQRPAACDEAVRLYFDMGDVADDLSAKEISVESADDLLKAARTS